MVMKNKLFHISFFLTSQVQHYQKPHMTQDKTDRQPLPSVISKMGAKRMKTRKIGI